MSPAQEEQVLDDLFPMQPPTPLSRADTSLGFKKILSMKRLRNPREVGEIKPGSREQPPASTLPRGQGHWVLPQEGLWKTFGKVFGQLGGSGGWGNRQQGVQSDDMGTASTEKSL